MNNSTTGINYSKFKGSIQIIDMEEIKGYVKTNLCQKTCMLNVAQ